MRHLTLVRATLLAIALAVISALPVVAAEQPASQDQLLLQLAQAWGPYGSHVWEPPLPVPRYYAPPPPRLSYRYRPGYDGYARRRAPAYQREATRRLNREQLYGW